jgi:prolyl 4-hydroxylase
MPIALTLSPPLRAWILHNLDRGCAPAQLVASMIGHEFEPGIARALVEAFAAARRTGSPLPGESLSLDVPAPERSEDAQRLAPGTRLRAGEREIPVLMRIERPAVALLEGVLDARECDALIELARPRLRPSTVVDPLTGANREAAHRNSEGMFFAPGETPLIDALDRRLSGLMRMPVENGEGLQVLRYGPGTQSTPHFDFLVPSNDANRASLARSGQRVSTLIVYLNDVRAGGETVFPELGLAVSPRKGHGLYFEYANARGELDGRSAHAGAPVVEGEKWAVTKWMRERRFVPA